MTQETRYAGYSARPSDYDCPDGQLAASLNLISEDNCLKPLFSPHTVTTLPDGDRIIFVHTTAVFSHYIVLDSAGNLCWTSPDGEKKTFLQVTDRTVHKINAVGNTLCILLSSGLHYVLWKDSGYKYLGQKPPEANLSFFTSDNYPAAYDRDTVETTDTDKVYYYAWRATGLTASDCLKITAGSTTVPFMAEHKSELQNPIWALINQANALVSKQGHFYAPFFVRYCYRMYDGSQWMASPPVFMPVSMPSAYRVEVPNLGYQTADDGTVTYKVFDKFDVYEQYDKSEKAFTISSLTFLYRPHNVNLAMRATGDIASLKADWGDIVKSIDIFVSLPIVREDPSATVASASLPSDTYGLRGGTLRKSFKNRGVTHSGSSTWNCSMVCDIPLLSEEAYMDKIRSVSSFYKVCSFDLETDTVKPDTFQNVPIDASVLPVLATQETLQDDYKSRNTILPLLDDRGNCVTSLYNYNGRQNIAGFRERLFSGFTPEVFAPYSTWNPYKDEDGDYYCADGDKAPMNVEKAYVFLATEDGERVVCADGLALSVSPMIYFNCPLFYPDNRAVRMELLSNGQLYVLKMQACPLLNGAFTAGGVMSSTETAFTTKPAGKAPSVSDTVSAAYKIYTSETNNPFFFPLKSSRDHCLRGFRGTPWKYFRIAALTTLTEDKSVSGASFSCEPRYTGRLK